MITFILAVAVACGTSAATHYGADVGWGWSVFSGILTFVVVQFLANRFFQKRLKADMEKVQSILMAGQQKIQQKIQRWQIRPMGSIQAAQKEIMNDMSVFVREALAQTATLNRYRLWVPMMSRQIATIQLQLNWQIKDFKAVDALMPKALFMEPTMLAIKLARMYMTDADLASIKAVYAKGAARGRYNANVLLAGTMSWIEVKKGAIDDAFKTLTEALKKSDNETLKRNHECLMNNRVGHFSNSGLGDAWYALHLEEPKYHAQRQRSVYR